MALQKVQSSTSKQIPFFDKWEEALPISEKEFLNGRLMTISTFREAQTGKGFMCSLDSVFNLFVWKNSGLGKLIDTSLENETGNLIVIQFVLKKNNLSLEFMIDDEVEVIYTDIKGDPSYVYEVSMGKEPPIAPDENRMFICQLPSSQSSSEQLSSKPTKPRTKKV